jgi:hypothetical protein
LLLPHRRQLPDEPLLLLCLGVAQIDAALTARHCKDRNTALLRGFAALHTYAKHRGAAAGVRLVA